MTRVRGGGVAGVWERAEVAEGTGGVPVTRVTDGTYGARIGTGGVRGDVDDPFGGTGGAQAGTGGSGRPYSHSPSRAVAVRPGAAAYRTARLPDFCPASCARRMMSNTAAPPRLPVV